jgi:hypothetical protein
VIGARSQAAGPPASIDKEQRRADDRYVLLLLSNGRLITLLLLANTRCGASARPRPALRRARYSRYVGKEQSGHHRGGVLRLVRSASEPDAAGDFRFDDKGAARRAGK